MKTVDFEKGQGMVPAIVQDAHTKTVLMLGYMNAEALEKTRETGKVTFYSRSKDRLWTKGESSGNFLKVTDILLDCDQDTLLVKALPEGPTCHTGADSCFKEDNSSEGAFLFELESFLAKRKTELPEGSYTTSLFMAGPSKIAQKVGEEAVELVIEAMQKNDKDFLNEASDLMYHLMVLLLDRGYGLADIAEVLKERH